MERPAPVRICVGHPHWGGRSHHTEGAGRAQCLAPHADPSRPGCPQGHHLGRDLAGRPAGPRRRADSPRRGIHPQARWPPRQPPQPASLLRGRTDRLRAGPAAAQPARALRGDRPVADPQGAGRQGPRPTGGIAGGWPGCTAPASWSASASQPSKRRPSGIFAAPEATWWKTSPVRATGWGNSCCAMGGCGGAGQPGRSSTRRGSGRSGSSSPPWPRRSGTTWPWSRSATRTWTRWRPTLPAGATARRSTGRSPGWPPTAASPGWAR